MPALTNVKTRMREAAVILRPDMHVHDAVDMLLKNLVSAGYVVDGEGHLIGVLAERDCLDAFMQEKYHDSPTALVGDLMTTDIVSIAPEANILEAAHLFSQHKFHHLPVVSGRRVIGEITRRDVLWTIIEQRKV